MEWLSENWFWVLIAGLFVGMHFFGHGHGGHGGGGCGGGHGRSPRGGKDEAESERPSSHQH